MYRYETHLHTYPVSHYAKAGVCCETPIDSTDDFIKRVKGGEMTLFSMINGEEEGWHEQSI